MLQIKEIKKKQELKDFINLPWEIYKNDPCWVPPLRWPLFQTLQGRNNPLLAKDPHTFFLALSEDQVVGRILVGVNTKLNRKKGKKEGYISLFEAVNGENVATSLFEAERIK